MATTTVVCLGVAGVNVSAEEHEVVKNDTLWDLSQTYNTSVQTIMDHNSMDSTNIFPGQKISIDGEATDKKEPNSEVDTYKVKAGDTLSEIGAEFGVSVSNLKAWNDLSSSVIITGQKLKVKQDANEEKQEVTEEPVAEEPAEEEVAQEPEPKAEENTAEKVETVEQEEPAEKAEPVEQSNEQEQSSEASSNGETKTVTATAYTAKCDGCSGVTSTGIDLNADPNKKVIAVDPSVIPLGTEVYVEGYGKAVAGDTGGAIKGNKIDLHVPSKEEANSWGVQTVNVEILD